MRCFYSLVVAAVLALAPAGAQADALREVAVTFVAEGGWDGAPGDQPREYRAIYHALRRSWRIRVRRRPALSFRQHVRDYAAVWKRRTERSRWLLGLNLQGSRPPAWPEHLRWDRVQPDWSMAVAQAARCLRGVCPDPLERWEPVHWNCAGCGSQGNVRALPRRLTRTLNVFYVIEKEGGGARTAVAGGLAAELAAVRGGGCAPGRRVHPARALRARRLVRRALVGARGPRVVVLAGRGRAALARPRPVPAPAAAVLPPGRRAATRRGAQDPVSAP